MTLRQYVIGLFTYVAYMFLMLAILASVGFGYAMYYLITHK
jgi:hypothetical protein